MTRKKLEKRKCEYCRNEYFTRLIKVYVFKERKCHLCNGKMFAYNDKKFLKCTKCGNIIQLNDNVTLGKMPVRIRGTSKDFRVAQAMDSEGVEVEKFFMPEKRYCQKCRNLKSAMLNLIKKRKMKVGTRELSIEEYQQIIKREVQKQLQKEHQTAEQKKKKQPKESVPTTQKK